MPAAVGGVRRDHDIVTVCNLLRADGGLRVRVAQGILYPIIAQHQDIPNIICLTVGGDRIAVGQPVAGGAARHLDHIIFTVIFKAGDGDGLDIGLRI